MTAALTESPDDAAGVQRQTFFPREEGFSSSSTERQQELNSDIIRICHYSCIK